MVNTRAEDYIWATFGGILIGIATTLNLLIYGRITGNSGIFNTLIKLKHDEGLRWKVAFFSGLVASTYLIYLITDKGVWKTSSFDIIFYDPYPVSYAGLHIVGWIIGGILVGVGTRMGNGCTSGHGVCGIPRLSIRSFVAVPTFMGCGIIVATFRHYVPFLDTAQSFGNGFEDAWNIIGGILALWTLLIFFAYMIYVFKISETTAARWEMPISWGIGFLFGLGLVISGMCRRTKILGFLTLYEDWDPALMLVMVGAIGVNIFTFRYIIHTLGKPYLAPKLAIPANKKIIIPRYIIKLNN